MFGKYSKRTLAYILLFVLLVVISILLAVSNWNPSTVNKSLPSDEQKEREGYLIGVSFLDQSNPYYAESWRGVQDEAAPYNIRLILKDPQSDAYQQEKDVEAFIEQQVDAIIIAALSPEIMDPVLAKARAQGIKVIAHSTQVKNCDIHLASDEWEMGFTLGHAAGEWINERNLSSSKIAILNYPRIPQINNRVKGMLDGLESQSSHTLVQTYRSASRPEEGYAAAQDILKEHPDIRIFLCINDGGALGVVQAIEEAGLESDDVFVGGVDATPEGLAKIRQPSVMRCSVDIYPYLTGQLDVQFAMRLLNGEIVPDRYTIPIKLVH